MAYCQLMCIALLYFLYQVQCSTETESLQLVVTLFRHGERTRESYAYPKDPYINEQFEPYGIGELISKGKLTEYKLGEMLRKRYNKFLGPTFRNRDVAAFTTNYSRTKCSLQLVLAGLFPPQNSEVQWNKNLNWNPIAYETVLPESSRIMSVPIVYCPRYKIELAKYFKSEKVKDIESNYLHQYPYLSENTGLNVTSIFDLYFLYDALTSENDWGLTLPEWTKSVYPEFLKNATMDNLVLWHDTPILKQLSGGFLLKKIINDMIAATKTKGPKIYLYSAHDVTVASLLSAMNVNFLHVPPFGACVIIELHNVKENYFVKVLYQDYTSGDNLKTLVVPQCATECPIKKFADLLQVNIPADGPDPCLVKE